MKGDRTSQYCWATTLEIPGTTGDQVQLAVNLRVSVPICIGRIPLSAFTNSAHSLSRRAEIDFSFRGLIDFFGREQHDDARFHGAAGLRDERDGRHVDVARQVHEDVKVVAAESEVERLQLPAHLPHELLDHIPALGAAFMEQTLQALLSVRALTKILWHVVLLSAAINRKNERGTKKRCSSFTIHA